MKQDAVRLRTSGAQRREAERAYRDPVHDFITLNDPLLISLIDTPEFQRLRRIRQLGATYGTYHGAEHSRFGHSLGVLWIMHKVLSRLQSLGHTIDPAHETVAYVAAALHDIGHGPLSHALENTITPGVDHEQWTQHIVLGNTKIHRLLRTYDGQLPGLVASIFDGSWQGPRFIRSLVTSQLDVDRMDYLIRDSVYTGVTYGHYDLERLINTLWVDNDQLILMRKGIVAAEEYILARYFMYWQVYFHKTTRGQEHLLRRLWDRAVYCVRNGGDGDNGVPSTVLAFLRGEGSLEHYLALDDFDLLYALKQWAAHDDPILSDLARRFLQRDLLKAVYPVASDELTEEHVPAVERLVEEMGWNPAYYVIVDRTSDVAYDYYMSPGGDNVSKKPILAYDETGLPQEIATLSHTIAAVATKRKVASNIYVPAPCVPRVREMLAAFRKR